MNAFLWQNKHEKKLEFVKHDDGFQLQTSQRMRYDGGCLMRKTLVPQPLPVWFLGRILRQQSSFDTNSFVK